MSEENKYELSLKAPTDLTMYKDWNSVAGDLENMLPGQCCHLITFFNDPNNPDFVKAKDIAENGRNLLYEALGDEKSKYDVVVDESEEYTGAWGLSVKRVE